jgi:hypothetical protein
MEESESSDGAKERENMLTINRFYTKGTNYTKRGQRGQGDNATK